MQDMHGQESFYIPADYQRPYWMTEIAHELDRDMPINERARIIAAFAHADQRRQSDGQPYSVHTDYVANGLGFSADEQALGYLHDVLEKSWLTATDLHWLAVPRDLVCDVQLLSTKDNGQPHFDNIEDMLIRPRCRKVKPRDIDHNGSDRKEFTALMRRKGQLRRLEARERLWDFTYPLTKAFIEVADQYQEWRMKTIVDFMHSAHCPEHLKDWEKLRLMTSHPVPRQAPPFPGR